MWRYKYKETPKDRPMKKEPIESGKGMVGVEMHEDLGWGEEHEPYRKKSAGVLRALVAFLTRSKYREE